MGETTNLNWWSPDFWTINSSTLGKESSITLRKPWSYCFINFFNAWNPKQPTFSMDGNRDFQPFSQVQKGFCSIIPIEIPPFKDSSYVFRGPPARCMYLWEKKSSPENGNSAGGACDVGHEAGELRVFVLDIWPQDLGPKLVVVPSSRPKQTRSESRLPSIPGEYLKPVRSLVWGKNSQNIWVAHHLDIHFADLTTQWFISWFIRF